MRCPREEEISCAINLIQNICEITNISLIVKEYKGLKLVAIHDNIDDKNYGIIKNKEGD